MKTLEELRKVFVEARKLALEGDPSKIDLVAKNLAILSAHCTDLVKFETEYNEKVKAQRLYNNIEKVRSELLKKGYSSNLVIKFFGLPAKKAAAPAMPIDLPASDDVFSAYSSDQNNSSDDVFSAYSSDQNNSSDDVFSAYSSDQNNSSDDVFGAYSSDQNNSSDDIFGNYDSAEDNSNGSADSLFGDIQPDTTYEQPLLIDPLFEEPSPMEVEDTFDMEVDPEEALLNPPVVDEYQASEELPMIQDIPVFDKDVADDVADDRKPKDFVPSENALEPNSFDDFIGQTHIVNRLKQEVQAASILGKKHLDNILLLGNKGLGKSTLMEIIAKELGVGYEYVDCTSFSGGGKGEVNNFHSFMLRIINENQPVVLGFDEIHAMPDKIQDRLLIMLQKRKYSYVEKGVAHNLDMPEFTFIGATTDYDVIREPVKDRCSNLTFTMEDYTRDELSQILCNKFATMGLTADGDVIERCVNRFRSSLRDIKAVVMGIYTKTVLQGVKVVTAEMAEDYFAERGLDPIGLNKKELEILNAIKDDPKGVVSEDTLAGRVYLDVKIFKTVYEPYLNKIGFITTTSRGRELTQRAWDYLNYGYYDFGNGYSIGTNPRKENEDKE